MTIGEYIRKLRKERGLTLRETSKRSNVSHPYLSQLENGRNKNPTPDVLRNLSKGLEVPYVELLQVAGYIEEAEKEGLSESAKLYRKYRQKKNTDLEGFYKENIFDIEELLSYETTLKYRSVILSEEDKDNILTFIKQILFRDIK